MQTTAVPTKLDAVLDPAWLSWALDDVVDGERVVDAEPVDSSKTLSEKVRFRVTVEGRDGARRTHAYCVKAHLDGSPGADLLTEARFYADLAPRLDVRKPRAYYAAVDDAATQAMIIMDDVLDDAGRACWIDWQLVQPGSWATDVSYHIATVLDIGTRRAHEADLLRHYLAELAAHGAPAPAWDEAWELYTLSFCYGYFLWAIT